jgi:site-specific DNA recombinase
MPRNSNTIIAAAYPRISQDKDKDNQLRSQTRAILAYGADNGITIPDDYVFPESFTGTIGLERPQLKKILQLARNGKINAIILYDLTRFARDITQAGLLFNEMKSLNLIIHIVEWNYPLRYESIGDYNRFMEESIRADIERRKILERTTRGKKDLADNGTIIAQGRSPYGLTVEGKKTSKRFVLVPNEVEAVQCIFRLYVNEKYTVREIMRYMNAHGYAPPSQKHVMSMFRNTWSDRRIYDILKNPIYTGRYYYMKREQVSKVLLPSGKWHRVTKIRSIEDQYLIEVPDIRIISDDMFNTAQTMISEGARRNNTDLKQPYLLNRRIRCACGRKSESTHNGKGFLYYLCTGKRYKTHPLCPIPLRMRATFVDESVWMAIEALLRNPKLTLQRLRQAQQQQQDEQSEASMTLDKLESLTEQYESELETLYREYKSNMLSERLYMKEKKRLDAQIEDAKTAHAQHAERYNAHILSDSEIDTISHSCATIADQLDKIYRKDGSISYEHRKKIIELLDVFLQLEVKDGAILGHVSIHGFGIDTVRVNFGGNDQGNSASGSHDPDSDNGCGNDRVLKYTRSFTGVTRSPAASILSRHSSRVGSSGTASAKWWVCPAPMRTRGCLAGSRSK